VKNVRLAFQTRRRAAWGDEIPDEIFLNYVLPHCNVTERRDDWREDFSRRFWPLVQSSRTASQAAMILNEGISKLIKLRATGTSPRAKPDPSPYETIQAGYASSSGLAILMVDMCRSVCVPARVVGTPAFVNPKNNQPPYHFWVEIWDGQWHVVSPGENKTLDQGWFLENCAQADPNNPRTCVYAVSYKKTATQFPIAWDETIRDVSGEDITYSYVKRIPVRLQVIDREDGMRILGHLTVKLRGRLIADAEIAEPTVFMLSAGQKYEAIVRAIPGPTRTRAFTAPSERGWLLALPVGD
jgi:hypothetical protein